MEVWTDMQYNSAPWLWFAHDVSHICEVRQRIAVHCCRVPDLDTRTYIEYLLVRMLVATGEQGSDTVVVAGGENGSDPHPTNPYSNSKTGHNAEWLNFKILWCAKARLCNYSLCSAAAALLKHYPFGPPRRAARTTHK